MLNEELAIVAQLIKGRRQAALGTLADGVPFVSMVAFVAEPDFGGFLLHLSSLSPHTRQLRADPRASLLIAEPETDTVEDVQTLARITLVGQASAIAHGSADYQAARTRYVDRLPASAMLFEFPDFSLFRFVPSEARYIGGFARAYSLSVAQLQKAAALDAAEG